MTDAELHERISKLEDQRDLALLIRDVEWFIRAARARAELVEQLTAPRKETSLNG